MDIKLFDSELKIMDILWKEGDLSARQIAQITKEKVGWSKTTTYTVIRKCVEKGAIERTDPGYICHAVLTKAEVRQYETEELINKVYDGNADYLAAYLIDQKKLSEEEIMRLREIVNKER